MAEGTEAGVKGVSIACLGPVACSAFVELRDELVGLLGDDLVALWAYGAAVSPEPPARLGDLDTHGVLARPPAPETAARMDEIRRHVDAKHGVELDSWYILLRDARGSEPPAHILKPELVDASWALHRSHWLAGRFVLLHGAQPQAIVREPTWEEVVPALSHELQDLEKGLCKDRSQSFASYAVLNCCRVAHSLDSRTGALSKRESAMWALAALPERWHEPILAAMRWYDRKERPDDERVLQDECRSLAAYARDVLGSRGVTAGR